MHSAPAHTDQNETRFARFGHSHGYRLEGDSALLNAQIDLSPSATRAASSFALQLWACEEPYRGGPLSGFKIAEAPIALSELEAAAQLDTVAFARPPAGDLTQAQPRDYSMVLVLAAGSEGSFDQVLDFANYPARQRFAVPHLSGAAGYKLHDDGSVSLHVDQVINPRADDNLSGTLSLQLWASERPYEGGELNGTLLTSHELGQVRGGDSFAPSELRSVLTRAVNGAPHLVLALSEWTALGYLVRDYGNFVVPHRPATIAPVEPVVAPASVAPAAQPAEAAPVKSVAPAAQPVEAAPVKSVASAPAAKPVEAAPVKSVASAPAAKPVEATPVKSAAPVVAAPVKSVAPAAEPAVAAPVKSVAPAAEPVAAAPVKSVAPSAEDARPSINTISEAELARLAEISPKLAGQVIKARPYKSVDDLRHVRGIGDKTVTKLRKLLTV